MTIDPEEPAPEPPSAVWPPRPVYTRQDRERAWERRRADLDHLSGIDDLRHRVDARAPELARRTAAILLSETNRDQPDQRNNPRPCPTP